MLFLTTLSSLGVLWGINIYITENKSKNWPITTAIVKESRVIAVKGKYGVSFCPEWSYEFSINTKIYNSSRNAFGVYSCFNTLNKAESALNIHPIGSKVNAIYNPDNPDQAALQLSSSGSLYWMLILIGSLCMFAGIMMLSIFIQTQKNEGVLM